MNHAPNFNQGQFYLHAIDILKGFAVFSMIFSHGVGWWNYDLSRNYFDSGSFAVVIIWITGLMAFPIFLFASGFNQVNSFLRQKRDMSSNYEIRSRVIKRGLIFFVFATIALVLMALIQEPAKILNYVVTWHLLHLFAFSTLYILFLWEASWFVKRISDRLNYQQYLTILFILNFITIIVLFIFFHEYTLIRESSRTFPVQFDLHSILENILLDISSCGIIPWLSFSLAGGLTASFLNLPNVQKLKDLNKAIIVFLPNVLFLFFGILCLRTDRFVSAGLGYASSFSHVFITIGFVGCINIVMILVFDVFQKIHPETISKIFYPFIIVSNISLTIYLIHPVVGVIDPSLIHTESILLFLVSLYCIFFIILAHIWQKWDYKYSFEWIIKKYS